jgi:hypothetical protein
MFKCLEGAVLPEDEKDGHEGVVEDGEKIGLSQEKPLGEADDDDAEGERDLKRNTVVFTQNTIFCRPKRIGSDDTKFG